MTSDSHYAMVCFMFVGQPSTLAVMVSPLLLSTLRLASYVKRVFPAAAKPLLPVLDAALARKVCSDTCSCRLQSCSSKKSVLFNLTGPRSEIWTLFTYLSTHLLHHLLADEAAM